MRLANSVRRVERELHTAKMKAVRSDRVMRVRFNCPAAGQYRMVELLGTIATPAADDADARPRRDATRRITRTRIRTRISSRRRTTTGRCSALPEGVAFSAVQTIDFWPNGSAHTVGASTPIAGAGVTLQVYDVKLGTSSNKSITVNGLGKISLH